MIPVSLRPATAGDLGLVYSSWMRSYWDAKPASLAGVPRELYFSDAGHHGVIDRLLRRPDAILSVACDTKDHDEIYGWACWSARALHYVYVKELWRRKGVASALVAKGPSLPVSHVTVAYLKAFTSIERPIVHDPYALMEAA